MAKIFKYSTQRLFPRSLNTVHDKGAQSTEKLEYFRNEVQLQISTILSTVWHWLVTRQN